MNDDSLGGSILRAAARGDDEEVRKLLEGRHPDSVVIKSMCLTPLLLAVWRRRVELARHLIEAGADVKSRETCEDQQTALTFAARLGDISLIEMLVNSGADLYARDRDGYDVMMWAAMQGSIRSVFHLRGPGMPIDQRSFRGETPLMLACGGCSRLDVIEILLRCGADVNARDSSGKAAAAYLAKLEHFDQLHGIVPDGHESSEDNYRKVLSLLADYAHRGEPMPHGAPPG